MFKASPLKVILECTGRSVYSPDGVFGVDDGLSAVTAGFSGFAKPDNDQRGGILTREEEVEIADHMIDRWQRFRQRALTTPLPPPVPYPVDPSPSQG